MPTAPSTATTVMTRRAPRAEPLGSARAYDAAAAKLDVLADIGHMHMEGAVRSGKAAALSILSR